MMSTQTGIPLDDPNVRPLDMSKLKSFKAWESPENVYQRFVDAQETFLKMLYTTPPDTSNHAAYKPYATVVDNGKVVATIDNHGATTTSNALGATLGSTLPGQVNGQNGPLLAQARAEAIANAVGGKVVKASTALTQSQFRALPKPQVTVDSEAMKRDPLYEQLQKTMQARALFLAQQAAQSPIGGAEGSPPGASA